MTDKELNSLGKQLKYWHSENKKAQKPINLILTGWVSEQFQGRLIANNAQHWGIDIHPKVKTEEEKKEDSKEDEKSWYSEIFDKDKLVYLTADSPNTLEAFEDDKIYIVGGLVDKNRHKNICFKKAEAQGISHAKFPIKENVTIGDYSTVLTVNQVTSIILAVKKYDNDWKKALEETLPKRKKQKVRGKGAKASIKEKEAKENKVAKAEDE